MVYTVVFLEEGQMLTIREYAKTRNVAYESVRKQVKRYSKELKGHTVKDGATMLDDYAMDFLDKHRMKREVNLIQEPDNEEVTQEIHNLKTEIEQLKQKLVDAQTEIINAKNETLAAHTKYQDLLERNQLLLEQKDSELQAYHKTIFGLYRKG